MKEIYKTNITLGSYIWGIAMIGFIIMLSYEGIEQGLYMGTLFLFLILAVTWYFTFFFNRYWIEGDDLFIRNISGTKSVNIKTIRRLERNKVDWFGTMRLTILRPYRKGMILHYNQIDNLFICPEKPAEFIGKLQLISPSIEITKEK
ncbi:hypothetical protein I6I97_10630 [Sphingobacterium multivorum]|uniref:PH domain-containing protein n=1 Tax=Sphingobacterium multivorum TaxID=28454 RepID=UPI00191AFB0F|nr:PH domain-containing protein [Sphingobacterium multivorum]QQT64192.1 hypothetical protein I6I97_10630 [Sphingobacterium multivorum]